MNCNRCRKKLRWTIRRGPIAPTRAEWFKQAARWRREEKRLAIRCLYCLLVFCPACARKHFAPMLRTQRRIDRVLETLASAAMKPIEAKLVRATKKEIVPRA